MGIRMALGAALPATWTPVQTYFSITLILAIIGYYVLRSAAYSSGGSNRKGGGVLVMLGIGVESGSTG